MVVGVALAITVLTIFYRRVMRFFDCSTSEFHPNVAKLSRYADGLNEEIICSFNNRKTSYKRGRWTPGDRPVNRWSRAFLFVAICSWLNRTYIATPENRLVFFFQQICMYLSGVGQNAKQNRSKNKTGSTRRLSNQSDGGFRLISSSQQKVEILHGIIRLSRAN